MLKLILGRLAGPAAVLLALILAVQTGRQLAAERHVRRLEAAISAPGTGWAARLAACRGDGAALKAALDGQNSAVARLKAAGEAKVAASAKAALAARAVAASYRLAADRALAAEAQPGESACATADRLILGVR